jgi:hypothetical protein
VSESVAARPGFTIRVSTIFILLAILGIAIPVVTGWGGHDGGIRAILAYAVFPWSAVIAAIASLVYLAKSRSRQSWLEAIVAVALVAFAGLIFL